MKKGYINNKKRKKNLHKELTKIPYTKKIKIKQITLLNKNKIYNNIHLQKLVYNKILNVKKVKNRIILFINKTNILFTSLHL